MITKLKNCNILTNIDNNVLFGTEILVCDNKIMQIGKSDSAMQTDCEIDLDGALVIPGLNNIFCFPYALGISYDKCINSNEYDSSIAYVKNKIDNNLDCKLLQDKFLSNGITSSYLVDIEDVKNIDFDKMQLGYFVSVDENLKDSLKNVETTISAMMETNYLKPILYINNILNLSEESIELVIQIAKKFDLFISVRVAKTLDEAGEIDKETGLSPISYLESLGFLDRKCLLLDCTNLDKEDINTLSLYNDVVVGLSLESDMVLGNGIAPVCPLLNKGIKIVLGLDNLGVSNLDIFREMYLTKYLQNATLCERDVMLAKEIFNMATSNFDIFYNEKVGKVEKGYLANLIAIKNDRINFNNVYDSIINLVSGNDVTLTMVDGKIVYKK